MGVLLKESSLSIEILNFQAICVAPNTYVSPIHQFKEINFNVTLVIFQLTHLNPRFYLVFHEILCNWFPHSHLSSDCCRLHHDYYVTIPQIHCNQISVSQSPNLPWVSTTCCNSGWRNSPLNRISWWRQRGRRTISPWFWRKPSWNPVSFLNLLI